MPHCIGIKMTTGQPQRTFVVLAVYILVSFNSVNVIDTSNYDVTHICKPGDTNKVNLQVRILVQNNAPIFKVYAFRAETGDTTQTSTRITDASCIKDASQNPILYDLVITTTDTVHPCGIIVTSPVFQEKEDNFQIVKFVFRVYAYEDMNSADDISYEAPCRTDDLSDEAVSTGELDISGRGNVILQQQLLGTYLLVRYAESKYEVDVSEVGDKVFLSVEFYPEHFIGLDNYGPSFSIGFPGIDPIESRATLSELYVILYPRYITPIEVTVTTRDGELTYVLVDGTPQKVILASDLMGCSNDGEAELVDKAVRIETDVLEIGVVVCSTENGIADCYTALPDDVGGKDYITVSMPVADEYSEIMIISHGDATSVTIDIPNHYPHVITLNGTSTSAGGELTFTLDNLMVFHLAQTSSTESRSNVNGYHITSDAPVTVLSGTRNYDNGHLVEQLLPTVKYDKDYVLISFHQTTFIVQPVQTGDTVIDRYLDATTSDTYTVPYGEYIMLDVASGEPCELRADKPVMVTMVINDPTKQSGFGSTMAWVPPVSRWSHHYRLYHPSYKVSVQTVFRSEADKTAYRVNGNPLNPTSTAVRGPGGYVFGAETTFGTGEYTLALDEAVAVSTFMVMGYFTDDTEIGVATQPFGYGLSDIGLCVKYGRRGDNIDNDCDLIVDEELLNGIDDDLDGLIDEDVRGSITENSGAVAVRVHNCAVSPDPTFPNDKIHYITGGDGCVDTTDNLFKPDGEFVLQTGDNIGTGIQPKLLYSGVLEISQFLDEPKLYFKCDIEKYCSSSSDATCRVMCGDSGGRKRRQDGEPSQRKNVTTDIWVFPYITPRDKPTVIETVKSAASFKACMDNSYIQMSFILLVLLMSVSFFTALSFCCLFRRRNNREKEIERKMYHNRSNKLFTLH